MFEDAILNLQRLEGVMRRSPQVSYLSEIYNNTRMGDLLAVRISSSSPFLDWCGCVRMYDYKDSVCGNGE